MNVCKVCHDPDPLWVNDLDVGADYMRDDCLDRWCDAEDDRVDRESRVTLERAARLDALTRTVAGLTEDGERLWNAVLEALIVSCWNTARTLSGATELCVKPTTVRERRKTARGLKQVLEMALDGAILGLGTGQNLAPSGSGIPRGEVKGIHRTDLLVDIQAAVTGAELSPEDLGMLVASRVGVRGLDLRRPGTPVRMRNWQIARATGLSAGEVRRRLTHADRRLTEELVLRGILEAESGKNT